MASRDSVRVLFATALLLLAGSVAYAQTASVPPKSADTPPETTAAAPGDAATEQAAEPEWRLGAFSFGADVLETSAYVWRGWVLHDGTCFQPDLWVSVGDFTVTSWINVRHNGLGDNRFNEHDLTVDYSRDVKRLTLSAGWINYRYFGLESGHTNELYAGARADVLLQPGIQVYKDVTESHGTYVSLSAGHEVPINEQVTLGGQVALGYNDHQYITTSGFSDLAVTFRVSIPLSSARASLQPTLTYSRSLMSDQFPSKLFGGLQVAFK